MVSIILLILKIIGILLLSVLGILLLLILFVLLVPLTYQVRGEYHNKLESLEIAGDVCWLLAMTKAVAEYKHPDFKWRAYFLWYKISSEDEEVEVRKPKPKKKKKQEQKKIPSSLKESSKKETNKSQPQKTAVEKVDDKLEAKSVKESPKEPPKEPRKETKKKSHKTKVKRQKQKEKQSVKSKISKTIRKICDTIKKISEIKEEGTTFLNDPINQHTFGKLKKEGIYLWKKAKPRVIRIQGDIGFEDPATTGKMLGVLGALYPIYGRAIQVTPSFDEVIYDGTFVIKGRTMLLPFVKSTLVLVLDKKVRKTYETIKEFQS